MLNKMYVGMVVGMVLAVVAIGCGSKKPVSSGPAGGDTAGGTSAAEPALNGCTTYKDMTKEGAYSVVWNESIASSDMRCIKIFAENNVSYTGNLTTHPMKAAGGDAPNPFDKAIDNISNPGSEQEATAIEFSKPGVYGFVCGVHPTMTGAVLVLPAPPPPS
jgi:plastocyanin